MYETRCQAYKLMEINGEKKVVPIFTKAAQNGFFFLQLSSKNYVTSTVKFIINLSPTKKCEVPEHLSYHNNPTRTSILFNTAILKHSLVVGQRWYKQKFWTMVK